MGKEQVINYVMNSPANTNRAVLEGMLDGMGGADVPTPTVEDAGKVLGVNENGNYTLTDAGGGKPLTVNITDDGTKMIMDKTWKEISDAFPCVRVVYDNDGSVSPIVLVAADEQEGGVVYSIAVAQTQAEGNPITNLYYTTSSENGYPTAL